MADDGSMYVKRSARLAEVTCEIIRALKATEQPLPDPLIVQGAAEVIVSYPHAWRQARVSPSDSERCFKIDLVLTDYKVALSEIADPSLRVERLRREAGFADSTAVCHDEIADDYASTADKRAAFQGEGDFTVQGQRDMAAAGRGLAVEYRGKAAALRERADRLERELAQSEAALIAEEAA